MVGLRSPRARRRNHGFIEPTARGRVHWYPFRFSAGASGVVAVDIRGRRWFTWRCLRHGRRMRRPYTDLSNAPHGGAPIVTRCVSLQGRPGWWRSTFVVDGGSPGGVYDTGDAVRRPYTEGKGFIERTARGRVHWYSLRFSAGASGVVAVDIRGQWWFTWRCLRHGRRTASPAFVRGLQVNDYRP